MTRQEFLNNIDNEVFLHETSLTFETRFKEIPGWDSMSVILLVDFFFNSFGLQITNKDLDSLITIEDLYNLLDEIL